MSDDARAGETPAPITPEGWPRGAGYAHGVAASGRLVSVAGQVGWDPVTTTFESDDMAVQTDRALANVVAVLAAAGARPEHVVRMTWYITDRDAYLAARLLLIQVYSEALGAPVSLHEMDRLYEERFEAYLERGINACLLDGALLSFDIPVLAAELRACGVDMSFTPVLDLDWGVSKVIGDRSFHRNPRAVSMLAASTARAFEAGAVSRPAGAYTVLAPVRRPAYPPFGFGPVTRQVTRPERASSATTSPSDHRLTTTVPTAATPTT